MTAYMPTPTGQHHMGDQGHYLTSAKNESLQILTKPFCQMIAC